MTRNDNIAIFEDTQRLCRSDAGLKASIQASTGAQEIIPERDRITLPPPRFATPAQIFVSGKRSLDASRIYWPQKTCVLNFASATNPGGGVTRGSTAQEECLCRCSTLFSNLTSTAAWQGFYRPHRQMHNQLYNDDCIYTPDVIVFKSDAEYPELLSREQWWTVDVISCAAPNLRPDWDGNVISLCNNELFALHVKRMRRILSIAAAKENDIVILGAYGCGAFRNPPEIVASALGQVTCEFRHHFKVIEFAVYCKPGDDRNYLVFKKLIGRFCGK